jgi:type II secretory ATPase GspE/PulE/Tfp pilus assembly ATPase PilB-like protein
LRSRSPCAGQGSVSVINAENNSVVGNIPVHKLLLEIRHRHHQVRAVLADVAEALLAGGVEGIEITFTVPRAQHVLEQVADRLGDKIVLGAGTVLDTETARIAIEAALTGHMVLTTLHTNDAPGAVARLAKMGIEAFLTASAIECVVAQRLARQLCTYCKQRTVIPLDALVASGFRVGADLEAYEPGGCGRCGHTGYRGRIGLFSVMRMSDELKELTVSGAAEAVLATAAREQGMLTLREDGLHKVRAGVTSIEEIARVST